MHIKLSKRLFFYQKNDYLCSQIKNKEAPSNDDQQNFNPH